MRKTIDIDFDGYRRLHADWDEISTSLEYSSMGVWLRVYHGVEYAGVVALPSLRRFEVLDAQRAAFFKLKYT